MKPLKIKICGMRLPANLERVLQLKPDLVGFIFYEKSPRYVGEFPDPALFSMVPPGVEKVAVFVNKPTEEILKIVDRCGLSGVQLHGGESPQVCAALQGRGITVLKAIPASKGIAAEMIEPYLPFVNYFLLDTPGEGYGGTGRKFDWDLLQKWNREVSFFLSGGIGAEDAPAILEIDHPALYGIDLNSRFELQPGIKDEVLLSAFIEKIRDGKQIKI